VAGDDPAPAGEYLGTVEAPDAKTAEAIPKLFGLEGQRRQRLLVRETEE
jgi:hypothetical protein